MTTFTQFAMSRQTGFDVNDADTIEIVISHDRKKIWINIDGILAVRSFNHRHLEITEHAKINRGAIQIDEDDGPLPQTD